MKHETTIDTVGIQIDYTNVEQQRETLKEVLRFTGNLNTLYIDHRDYLVADIPRREYYIYAHRRIVASINTGAFRSGSYLNNDYAIKYYVNIKFAGLKTYNSLLDKTSNDYLLKICAYLNENKIHFKLTELDICIDVECAFENILAICTKRSPKTNYYSLADRQAYDTTAYIEKITKKKLGNAVLRAYTYDKSHKEDLDYSITRFEVKLQPKYFNKHGFSIKSIEKALDRYYVMYFEDTEEKYSKIAAYNGYQAVRKREVQRLRLDEYRLFFDIGYIDNFINKLLNANDFKI